jgi:hypothetical protein
VGAVREHSGTARRSVVPERAGRSPWLAAIWTGFGAAVVCALIAVVLVAICWLPVSGEAGRTDGRTTSALRAGLLSFLAAVHGGVTVDGVSVAWLPLGMLLLVAAVAWRAGTGLADAAEALGERDPLRLMLVAAAQAATFTLCCLVAVPFATLGTSRAPFLGTGAGALLVFALSGGTSFVRHCALREAVAEQVPAELRAAVRCATAAVLVYLAGGAALVGGSVALHGGTVEDLTRSVGGGWGGVPVLLLGILAAPNAAIAGSAYLAGPGFAVGAGTHVGLFSSTHGVVPAFPLLGALPSGTSGNPVALGLAGVTAVFAGLAVARLALRADGWLRRAGRLAGGALGAGLIMLVLGWQAGGALGDARLSTVGPSPVLFAGAVAATVALTGLVTGALLLALRAVWRALGVGEDEDDDELSFADLVPVQRRPRLVVRASDDGHDDGRSSDELAG